VFELKVSAQHTPNVPVHVVLMRGRLGEGKADDARYKPATLAATVDVEVEPAKNQVTSPSSTPRWPPRHPGEHGGAVEGRPGPAVGGEVTLWMVDEAVLSLAKEASLDPLTQVIVRNQRITSVRDSRNLVLGRWPSRRKSPAVTARTRTARAAAAWCARIQDGAVLPGDPGGAGSGRLVVPVQLSDDLTNFKVRGGGHLGLPAVRLQADRAAGAAAGAGATAAAALRAPGRPLLGRRPGRGWSKAPKDPAR